MLPTNCKGTIMPVSQAKVAIPGKRPGSYTLPNPPLGKGAKAGSRLGRPLNQSQEADALQWVEAVSEFDERETR